MTQCNTMLTHGFTVTNAKGETVRFGREAKMHIEEHRSGRDIDGRKTRLLYAIDAVRTTEPIEDISGFKGRRGYAKIHGKRGVLVLTNAMGVVEYAFDVIPKDPPPGKPTMRITVT